MTFSDTAYRAPKATRVWLEQLEKHPPEAAPRYVEPLDIAAARHFEERVQELLKE